LAAAVIATWLKERCKARRVLLSTDGPYDNVLKIKPPMVFGRAEVDLLVDTLRCARAGD
jgi:ethanolamine-phosphate phospho-lyase